MSDQQLERPTALSRLSRSLPPAVRSLSPKRKPRQCSPIDQCLTGTACTIPLSVSLAQHELSAVFRVKKGRKFYVATLHRSAQKEKSLRCIRIIIRRHLPRVGGLYFVHDQTRPQNGFCAHEGTKVIESVSDRRRVVAISRLRALNARAGGEGERSACHDMGRTGHVHSDHGGGRSKREGHFASQLRRHNERKSGPFRSSCRLHLPGYAETLMPPLAALPVDVAPPVALEPELAED
jgi:hypothetical protein